MAIVIFSYLPHTVIIAQSPSVFSLQLGISACNILFCFMTIQHGTTIMSDLHFYSELLYSEKNVLSRQAIFHVSSKGVINIKSHVVIIES